MVSGYYFPFNEDRRRPLGDTILDGELVIDVDPKTQQVEYGLLRLFQSIYFPIYTDLQYFVMPFSFSQALTNRTLRKRCAYWSLIAS